VPSKSSRLLVLVSVLQLAAGGTAQNITVPARLQGLEGTGSQSLPFGITQTGANAVRYMCLYDAEELPWTGPRVISAIALRADNDVPNTTSFPQINYVSYILTLSTSTVRVANVSANFDANHGIDRTVVVQNGSLVLPAQPAQAGVRPANIVLPFDAPWVYGMNPLRTAPAPTTLVIDLQIWSQPGPGSGNAYRLDNFASCSSQPTLFGSPPGNCTANRNGGGAGNAVTISGGSTMLAGGTYVYTLAGMPPSTTFSLVLDLSNQGTFLGQPLPYPLFDPANPQQPLPGSPFPFAAPDCWVNVAPVHAVPGTSSASGTGNTTVAVPLGHQFVGVSMFAQAVVLDPTANQMRLVTTQGLRSTVCGPLGVARVHFLGNHLATSGSAVIGQGAVFEVQ